MSESQHNNLTGSSVASGRPRASVIGFDGRPLSQLKTGVERYTVSLMREIAALAEDRKLLVFAETSPADETFCTPPWQWIVVPPVPRIQRALFDTWLAFQVAQELPKHGVQAFYSISTKIPFTSVPCVATIHGLEWYRCPDGYSSNERMRQRLWLELAARYSNGIVTFARSTHRDLTEIKRSFHKPVFVVPEASDSNFRVLQSQERDPTVIARHGITRPFALSVCSLDPRKNLTRLISGFAKAGCGDHLDLVLVGRPGPSSKALRVCTEAHGISRNVIFTGYVSDSDLVQLYNHASVFVYPSLYEGFGLPVLEAMACGLPVVTSSTSSLPEVARHAAILVDPTDDAAIGSAIMDVATHEEVRARQSKLGLARASAFSWQRTARGVLEFLDEIAGNHRAAMPG
jgi:glycosyltransferase involved in cell wall biosynthesis